MSMYEASCEAEAALLSSVSHWRQSFLTLASELKPFLVDFSVGKSEQFVAPQYVCMCVCGVTLMLPVVMPRHATGCA